MRASRISTRNGNADRKKAAKPTGDVLMDKRPETSGADERPLVAAPPVPSTSAPLLGSPAIDRAWEQFVWQDTAPGVSTLADGAMQTIDSAAQPERAASADPESHEPVGVPLSAAVPPPLDPAERHEHWRRQLLTALKDVDDESPIPAPPLASPTSHASTSYTHPPRGISNNPRAWLSHPLPNSPPPSTAQRLAGHSIATAAAVVCIFSIGALWATFRSAPVTDVTPMAAALHQVQAPAEDGDSQPMLNKPVLVREGESPPASSHAEVPPPAPEAETPALAPLAEPTPQPAPAEAYRPAGNSMWRQPPAAPSPPPIQVAPRSAPLIINRPVTALTVPAAPGSREQRHSAPAALPAPSPSSQHHRKSAATPPRSASASAAARISSEAYQATAPEAPRARPTPRPKWDNRRQGLRTAPRPEPEPSTLKKLLNAVWPGSSADKGAPAKPEPPAEPAKPVQPHNWSDLASPDP